MSFQEWVWPMGYFLRARLHFASLIGDKNELLRVVGSTEAIISRHFVEASTNHWRGLPELTNKDGAYCKHSCRTQAWSASSIIEVCVQSESAFQRVLYESIMRRISLSGALLLTSIRHDSQVLYDLQKIKRELRSESVKFTN